MMIAEEVAESAKAVAESDFCLGITETHWGIGVRHLGSLKSCDSPDCRGVWEQYCRCSGVMDCELIIEDGVVKSIYHHLCEREIDPDSWDEFLYSDGAIPVKAQWSYSEDWETGYTEQSLIVEAV